MSVKIGINGFGRIGRMVFRALAEQGSLNDQFEVAAINDLVPADNLAYLLKYDSIQGRLDVDVGSERSVHSQDGDDVIVVNGQQIPCLSVASGPRNLPWRELGVKVVVEATGLFADEEASRGHLEAGAEKVIISAPAKGNVKTVVLGVNDEALTAEDAIISNASCTTNCLAPLAKVGPRGLWYRRGIDDYSSQLHGNPEDKRRPLTQGLEGWSRSRSEHHTFLDGRGGKRSVW